MEKLLKTNPPLAHVEEDMSWILIKLSASELPGRSGELETTQPKLKLQEAPSETTAGPSDQNGQNSDCNSFQGTFSVRAEENQENQHLLPRTEEIPPHSKKTETLRQDPRG